jgi:hypothetical protein
MKNYIYLAHRDKEGIKLLGSFKSNQETHQKINPNELKLSKDLEKAIAAAVFQNRMKWDLWIESANDYQDLSKKLKNRGFKNLSKNSLSVFDFALDKISVNKNYVAFLKKN